MSTCTSCDLVARRDRGEAPLWDEIVRTPCWDVVHCTGTSVEGWLVLGVRTHRHSIAELSEAEAAALGPLLRAASIALQQVMGCEKTYVVQFAEHPQHPHVHFHLIPRAADLPDDEQGMAMFRRLGLPPEDSVPEDRMDEIAVAVRRHLMT